MPDEAAYPDKGALISDRSGDVNFRTLKALGVQFVYLEASNGADAQDIYFTGNFERALDAGLSIGVVHRFDPCIPADGQSANFRDDGAARSRAAAPGHCSGCFGR